MYTPMIHGGGNYLATLKYLWNFARIIAQCGDTVTETEIDNSSDEAWKTLPEDVRWRDNVLDLECLVIYALDCYSDIDYDEVEIE